MSDIMQIFRKQTLKKIIALIILLIFIYIMKDMINLMLLTFVFTYLINSVSKSLIRIFEGKIKISYNIMIVIVSLLLTSLIFIILIDFLPLVIDQLTQVIKQVHDLYTNMNQNEITNLLKEKLDQVYGTIFSAEGINYIMQSITNVSRLGMNIIISLILSIFFLLEKEKIIEFTTKFKYSKISLIYNEIEFFGKKFMFSFGKVIEVQIVIAIINGILSTIGLSIIGFPHLLGFGIMVVLLGLIPVAGVIISIIPLSIVAFNAGGLIQVIYVLLMIVLLHAFEAYLLNPKLMSSKTKLPIFYTLIILIVSEHIAGIWGLIIGIPVFMFILDVIVIPDDDNIVDLEK